MEHLSLPRKPIRRHPEVALSSSQFDDPGDFLTYPSRYSHLVSGGHPHVPNQRDVVTQRGAAAVSSDDILDYYQGWLFFALLAEFFGPTYDSDNYVRAEEVENPGKILKVLLTTKNLHSDLANWRTNGPLSAILPDSEYHQHLEACLDVAFEAFDDLERSFTGFAATFTAEILSLAGLCETLDSFIATAVEHGPVSEMPHRGFPEQAKRDWRSKVSEILDLDDPSIRGPMIEAGWCPGDISRMTESFSSIAAYYYFSNFKPDPAHPNLHEDCPSWGCTLRTEVKTTHMGGQSDEECDCPGMVSFEEESLVEIYERGEIPVFTLGRMEDGNVGVALTSVSLDPEAQKDPENRYVALSHVWSEGMGNPLGNGLPFCRVSVTQYWAMLAQQIVRQSEEEERDRDPYATGINVETEAETVAINLWIDTMCCPATPGYGKNLCLARMRDIYSNAYAVLVQSVSLEDMSIGPFVEKPERGVMDIAAQLYTSPWMRRMWTLQEGVLAGMRKNSTAVGGRLVLGYGGGLLSLESVVGLLKQAPAHEAALAFDMIGKFAELTPMPYGFDDDERFGNMRTNTFLGVLSKALKYRSVSVPSDELICLATLLGVRVGNAEGELPLIDSEGSDDAFEQGMCELWKRIEKQDKGIPGDVIFSSVPRIAIDGFRWAPKTFIQHAKYGHVFFSSSADDEEDKEPARTLITGNGLQVKFPGIKLNVDLGLHGTPLVRKSGNEPKARAQRVMFMQLPAGGEDWYSIHIHQLDQDDLEDRLDKLSLGPTLLEQVAGGKICLLMRKAQPLGRGLLVTVEDDSSSSIPARSEYPVTVGPVAPTTAYICSTVQQHLRQLRDAVAAAGQDAEKKEVLIREELTKLLSKSETDLLRDALTLEALGANNVSASDEQVMDTFVKTANLVAELGGVDGTFMDVDQSWIVD
ncbi:hypothetical protein QBC44DRAFT_237881 [Cladorrhinum sp. PSN332]|nr:hypothetical protein QBC44DRAFT_237881 [Cladorrhinum sp. PSN332]